MYNLVPPKFRLLPQAQNFVPRKSISIFRTPLVPASDVLDAMANFVGNYYVHMKTTKKVMRYSKNN